MPQSKNTLKKKNQNRILKKLIKKMSKGYFKDFDEGKTLHVHPDDLNDHTLIKEQNDHTDPKGKSSKK